LALKEDIKALKDELTTQEHLLENIIKSERFFKRNKRKIIAIIATIIVGIFYYVISDTIKQRNLVISNKAYRVLQQDPQNSEMIETLKSKNKPLFRLFTFQQAVKSNDTEALSQLSAQNSSDLVGELSLFYLGKTENVKILDDYIKLQKGYEFIKEGKMQEASLIFQTIPADSQLVSIINALEHYKPEVK
jgi:hypothetical protein